jgi:hypothetical protein
MRCGFSRLPSVAPSAQALEYARHLHTQIFQANRDLHTRAQVVLTVNGLVISTLGTIAASQPEELKIVLGSFRPTTWVLLFTTGIALVLSVVSAALCLMSTYRKTRTMSHKASIHEADDKWFYGDIAKVDRERFLRLASTADEYWETRARLVQAWIVAPIIRSRAKRLNLAYGFAALAFTSMALTLGDYMFGLN